MIGVKVTVRRLALVLAGVLLVGTGCLTIWPKVAKEGGNGTATNPAEKWIRPHDAREKSTGSRSCTVDELLPLPMASSQSVSSEWSHENVLEPPYGCDCASSKGRYFCPNLGVGGYPKWAPRAAAEGVCRSRTREELMEGRAPLPPGFKVLFYGNSYVRQAVEAILCIFERDLTSKRVRFEPPPPPPPETANSTQPQQQPQQQQQQQQEEQEEEGEPQTEMEERTVTGGEQCRACSKWRVIQDMLAESGCVADVDGEACRCDDDHGEFFFSNGAVVHFFFANDAANKTLSDALIPHGPPGGFSSYDAVFANEGNDPPVDVDSVLDAAFELRDLGVPFFWLSTYEGKGDPKGWSQQQEAGFRESGARFVRVGDMAHGLGRLTRKIVEQSEDPDPHFCMPGVPDEVGLLLLKLMWAVKEEAT